MNDIRITYDYYEQTCSLCRQAEKKRDRLFIYQFISCAVLAFIVLSPETSSNVISEWLHGNLHIDLVLSSSIITGMAWIIVLFFLIRYIQTNIYIERLYPNIHETEKSIAKVAKEKAICREGKNYLKKYPAVQTMIYWLYAYVFPTILTIFIFVCIILDYSVSGAKNGMIAIDIIAGFIYIALSIGYLCFRVENRQK